MEGSPHLFDFEGEMAHYASLEEEIQELPELRQLGAILLSVGGWCKGSSTTHSIHTAIHAYIIHTYVHTYICSTRSKELLNCMCTEMEK